MREWEWTAPAGMRRSPRISEEKLRRAAKAAVTPKWEICELYGGRLLATIKGIRPRHAIRSRGPRVIENPEYAFGGQRTMYSLIERIYSGVGKEAEWPGILDHLNEAVGAELTLIFSPVVGSGATASARTPQKLVQDFLGYYASVNVLAEPCDAMFATGEVRYSHWAVADNEFERSEFYNDFFQRHNVFYSMGLKVPLGAGAEAYLSCQRPRAKGPFEEHEGMVYATLLPHLRRAQGLHARFRQLDTQSKGLEASLDLYGHAVLGFDCFGGLAFCTETASALVGQGSGIRITGGGLRFAKTGDGAALRHLLGATLSGGPGGAVCLSRVGASPLRVTVSPYRGSLLGGTSVLAALVFLQDSSRTPPSRSTSMRALYGLTPTECRVADLLLEGLETGEVAERLRITPETARFHVKRILTKTGTRRRSELMRLMLSLPHTP
jgi:DNA-binding CsgD family transcriptional regulator